METNKTTYKSIDLFAGIGGIRLGFERAFGKKSIRYMFRNGTNMPKKHIKKTLKTNLI